ncbi:MAG: prephenate dehydratase [Muribaculaceae bacterium]|nr:prephenate dehydratase [Muribaculaceae bacterium]
MSNRVVIQGVAGCFHDAAARQYFGKSEIETIPAETFPAMFESLEKDSSLLGIMAIENTIAGSILPNHDLLRKSNLQIVGEHKMRISHVLCALPGQNIDELSEVNSHPMALMQCEQYLRHHPNLRMVEKFDTAGAAMEIASKNLQGHAAVCGEYAANLYNLDILEKGIETNKRNFTRFLLLADSRIANRFKPVDDELDKASIEFTLPHTHGALSKILTILSFYDMNLSKIQSLPIIGREWEYRFYIDLTFENFERYRQAITAVRPLMNDFQVLGVYQECKNPVD